MMRTRVCLNPSRWGLLAVLRLLALGLVLTGSPAWAQVPEEPRLALPGSSPVSISSIPAPPVTRLVLPNGLVLLVQESPFEDIVAVELLVRAGVQQEGSNLTGLTSLIQDLLSDRITKDTTGQDIVEITGSLVTTQAEPDYARISLLTTPEYLEFMIGRLGQALRQRASTTSEVDQARSLALQALQGNQGAFSALYEVFLDTFYRYHPYKRTTSGVEGSVRKFDPQAVDAYFQRYYVPNRMVLSVAGKVDGTALAELVRREFASLEPVRETSVNIQWEPKASEKEVFLAAGSRLAWVFLGYPAPSLTSRDYAAMRVIHCLLGEGISSRLWIELREKRGLAYELGSIYPDLEGPSHILAYIITRPNSVGESRRRILGEVDRLKKERISQSELEDTQRKLIGNYLLERETNQGKAFHRGLAEILGLGYESDMYYLRHLQETTPQDVQRVARLYLDSATLVVARPGGRFYLDF
ncbi:MAG: M16 family metallopeptidase [Candidatus Xenobium sp.]|jgi:zinc protease|nr:insulinase family protein [Burkholderiales bacterium]